jgi:dTDP-glucose 4,6-dehydratase
VVRRVCDLMGKDFESATVTVGERLGQDAAYIINSTRARTELGWRPTVTIDEGLAEVVRWVNEGWSEIVRQPLEYRHAA